MYGLTERDKKLLTDLVSWFRYNKGRIDTIFRRNPRLLGGDRGSVVWAKVIRPPAWPDATAIPPSPAVLGQDFYNVRLVSSTYPTWDPATAYITGQKVIDGKRR